MEVAGSDAPLVDPDDRDGWIDAVRVLLADRDGAEARAATVRARSAARFNWTRCAEQTRAVYALVDR